MRGSDLDQEAFTNQETGARPILSYSALIAALGFCVLQSVSTPAQTTVDEDIQTFDRLLAAGHYAEAEAPLENYTSSHPQSSEAWYQLGYLYFRLHKIWPSIQALSKSLSIRPKQADAHKILGLDFSILGRLDLAEYELRRAVALEPGSVESQYSLGRVCYERGNYERAARHLEQALQLNPNHVKALHNLGLTYEGLNQYDRARQHFEKAIALNETSPAPSEWPYIDFATFLNHRGQHQLALDLLRKGERINPKSDPLEFEMAKAYRGLAEWELAAKSLEKAARVNPRNAEYFYVLFLTYKKLGKAAEARDALAEFEKLKQSDSQAAAAATRH